MQELINFQKKLQSLDLVKIALEILNNLSPELIDLNHEQLQKGKDSLGIDLPEYANEDYFIAKKAQGKATAGRRYNLNLYGDFYEKFYTYIEGQYLNIDSRDEKRDKLVALTSIEIFGVENKELDKFLNERFLPLYLDAIGKHLQIL